jgi:hypothetical protein
MSLAARLGRLQKAAPGPCCPVCDGRPRLALLHVFEGDPGASTPAGPEPQLAPCPACGLALRPRVLTIVHEQTAENAS